MPHITIEYSANIADQLDAPALMRKIHDHVADHDIDAYKIKSRLQPLSNYIIGDEQKETSMVHVTCLLLEGRPVEFGHGLSGDIFSVLQDHIQQQVINKCASSVEVREMNKNSYKKSL